MKRIEEMLAERIAFDHDILNNEDLCSDTHKAALDEVIKLTDRAIELEKAKIERKKQRAETIDKAINTTLTAVKVAGMIAVPVWGTIVTLTFEKENVISAKPTKQHIDTLLKGIFK